jgi:serine/threonine protein kinase/tetratricopeptide (TPR) repeat protein
MNMTVGHYTILEELGRGGMGVVYKARDTKLDRLVAIKTLPPHIAANREEHERFAREARAAASLNHPNIATIYSIEEHEGGTFIVMEYIEGTELREKLRAGPLALDIVLDLGLQIAGALQAAHRKGIVHRDVKSANIMIAETGQAKVMDFGLAKVRGAAQVTREGTTVGTAAYMSPEQARGEEVDHRSDIWSFGVVLYEMLTGRPPFASDYDQAVVYGILNEEPRPVNDVRPETPGELGAIISKTLAKDPGDRQQSMDEVIAGLRSLRGSTGSRPAVQARPASSGKRWLPVALVSAGALVVLVVALALFLRPGEAPEVGKSIAVLPFENMNRDEESEYFSDGITEDIITQLSKIGELRVISRSSSMRYKGSEKGIRDIGTELGVATILEGSIRRSGNRVRITSQLIDVSTDEHLWAETYDRDLADIFEVQSDVARHIAAALQATLTSAEEAQIDKRPTENLSAYDYYLKGREYYLNYRERDNENAIGLFHRALELDPNFALAYAGLGDAYAQRQWRFGYPLEWLDSSVAMSTRALALDRKLAEGHKALGLAYEYKGWLHQAREENLKAIEANPNYQHAIANMGWVHFMLGDLGEAFRWMKRSVALNPADAQHYFALGTVLNSLGEYNRAVAYFDKALDLQPDFEYAYWGKANVSMVQGKHEEARRDAEQLLKLAPEGFTSLSIAGESRFFAEDFRAATGYLEQAARHDSTRVAGLLAVAYHRMGDETAARAWAACLERREAPLRASGSELFYGPYALARLRAMQGRADDALQLLEEAVDKGFRWKDYLERDPSFGSLRTDRRFEMILQDLAGRTERMKTEVASYDR